jgi:GntR family transcriptional regulator/MocR family aminotransferase
LRVSRTTTLLAYEQLLAEGYLQTRRGSGTFVAEPLPDDLPLHPSPRRVPATPHPHLSTRGAVLAGTPGPARRIGGPLRAFRLGVPALDRFPLRLWSQLVSRRMRSMTPGQLDYADSTGCLELRTAIATITVHSTGEKPSTARNGMLAPCTITTEATLPYRLARAGWSRIATIVPRLVRA